eukprot:gene7466-3427_t
MWRKLAGWADPTLVGCKRYVMLAGALISSALSSRTTLQRHRDDWITYFAGRGEVLLIAHVRATGARA